MREISQVIAMAWGTKEVDNEVVGLAYDHSEQVMFVSSNRRDRISASKIVDDALISS